MIDTPTISHRALDVSCVADYVIWWPGAPQG